MQYDFQPPSEDDLVHVTCLSTFLSKIVNCDVLIKQSLAEESKVGEAIKSFMEKRMEGIMDL